MSLPFSTRNFIASALPLPAAQCSAVPTWVSKFTLQIFDYSNNNYDNNNNNNNDIVIAVRGKMWKIEERIGGQDCNKDSGEQEVNNMDEWNGKYWKSDKNFSLHLPLFPLVCLLSFSLVI